MVVRQLSADATLARLGPNYAYMALTLIQRNFAPPHTAPGISCEVQFRIMADGEIRDWRVTRSTGRPDLDRSAIEALKRTGRLPPLYEDLVRDFVDVQVTFAFEPRG